MSPTDPLARLRQAINQTDDAILRLVEKRSTLAAHIAKTKKEQGQPLITPDREKQVANRIATQAKTHKLPAQPARRLAQILIALCRPAQRKAYRNTPPAPRG